jgi:hypothetical protein
MAFIWFAISSYFGDRTCEVVLPVTRQSLNEGTYNVHVLVCGRQEAEWSLDVVGILGGWETMTVSSLPNIVYFTAPFIIHNVKSGHGPHEAVEQLCLRKRLTKGGIRQ